MIALSGIVLNLSHLLLRETNITINIPIFKQLTKAQRDKVSAASCAGNFFKYYYKMDNLHTCPLKFGTVIKSSRKSTLKSQCNTTTQSLE